MESANSAFSGPGSVSACLVVRHEEAVIERCLASLEGVVGEVVLVHDGECEDRTLEIAERHGCRIFVRPLVGHAEVATVFAYEQARGEWILSIDADEYLSEPLRRELRQLVQDEGVNGYELLLRKADATRYLTENGPFALRLFRRSRVHVLGMIHANERVDPPIRRVFLEMEHRPLYDNYALRTLVTKQRRWARIHARELLGDLSAVPSFNWDGPVSWSIRRRILNRLSPVLFIPYLPVAFVAGMLRERSYSRVHDRARMALQAAVYASLVQFYVAKYFYLGADDEVGRVAQEPPRPTPDQGRV